MFFSKTLQNRNILERAAGPSLTIWWKCERPTGELFLNTCSFIHNSPSLEIIQGPSTGAWIYSCSGQSLLNRNYNKGDPQKRDADLNPSVTGVYVVWMIHLSEILEQEKLINGGENQNDGCLTVGRRLRMDWERAWGNFLGCWFLIYLSGLTKCTLEVCSFHYM